MIPLLLLPLALARPAAPPAASPAPAGDAAQEATITLLITNATEVARKEKGAALITVAGAFMDIDRKTQKVIAERMTERLAAQGVEAAIVPDTITFPSARYTAFYLWDPAQSGLVPVTLALGDYRVLQVDIHNVDALVAAETGSLVVDLAHFVGYDLRATVNERAAPKLLQELEAQGVHAVAAW